MGSSGQLSGSFDDNAFLKILEGAIPRVYFAENSDVNKIIHWGSRQRKSGNTPTGDRKKKSSSADLLDLRLPPIRKDPTLLLSTKEELPFKHFIDLLRQEKYDLCNDTVSSGPSKERQYQYVQQHNVPLTQRNIRRFIYIPKEFLVENPQKKLIDNLDRISAIYYEFTLAKPRSIIIAFSNKKGMPHPAFRNILQPENNPSLTIHLLKEDIFLGMISKD